MTHAFGTLGWHEELNLLEKQIRIARDENVEAIAASEERARQRTLTYERFECQCCSLDHGRSHTVAEDGHCGWCRGQRCTIVGRFRHWNWDSRGDMVVDLIRVASPLLFVALLAIAWVTR